MMKTWKMKSVTACFHAWRVYVKGRMKTQTEGDAASQQINDMMTQMNQLQSRLERAKRMKVHVCAHLCVSHYTHVFVAYMLNLYRCTSHKCISHVRTRVYIYLVARRWP